MGIHLLRLFCQDNRLIIKIEERDKVKIDRLKKSIWEGIKMAESWNSHTNRRGHVRMSHKGAIGKCQVTWQMLKHYNQINSTEINILELFNEFTNEMIGYWGYELSLAQFDNPLYGINSYNAGIHGTRRGNFLKSYVQKVMNFAYNKYTNK